MILVTEFLPSPLPYYTADGKTVATVVVILRGDERRVRRQVVTVRSRIASTRPPAAISGAKDNDATGTIVVARTEKVELDTKTTRYYNILMYTFDQNAIDAKFAELLKTVKDADLRSAMTRRLKRNAHLVAGAILVDNNQRICLVQEAKGPWASKWNLPIGHLEYNETTSAGAKREIKEEAGYDVKFTGLLPPQNVFQGHTFRILYVGKVIGGSPDERDKNDISAVSWFTIPEIEAMSQNQQLRDPGVMYDVSLYKTGARIPLDTIHETKWGNDL